MTHHLRFDVAELGALHVAAWVRSRRAETTGPREAEPVRRGR